MVFVTFVPATIGYGHQSTSLSLLYSYTSKHTTIMSHGFRQLVSISCSREAIYVGKKWMNEGETDN
jgi:hypothetical protein